jgi:hypothetical protein
MDTPPGHVRLTDHRLLTPFPVGLWLEKLDLARMWTPDSRFVGLSPLFCFRGFINRLEVDIRHPARVEHPLRRGR